MLLEQSADAYHEWLTELGTMRKAVRAFLSLLHKVFAAGPGFPRIE
jgi:hypothetical protein